MPQKNQFSSLIEKLGLNKNEAAVYEVLLTNGVQSIKKLTTLLPKISRTNLYNILNSLEQKELISTEDKVKLQFKANSPYALAAYVSDEKRKADEAEKIAQTILPSLNDLYKASTERPVVRVLEGFEGVKQVYEDTLKENQPIYAFLELQEANPRVYRWLRTNYAPRRAKAQIKAFVIVSANKNDEKVANYQAADKEENRESYLVKKGSFPAHLEVQIYGNKVSFANYNKVDALMGVIIENKFIASSMKGLWDLAKQAAEKKSNLDETG
ncbi:MAG: helix-turn-helix domain-containing protein [bacterium]|nr:hypothetical protein [Patescibacteria group bacterium]